jgi:hypothetical protein
MIVGSVLIFQEVRVSRLVEISTLMTKAPNSVGSNPCSHYTMALLVTNPCTHELAKKAMSLQANREHKQEQERTILNCR